MGFTDYFKEDDCYCIVDHSFSEDDGENLGEFGGLYEGEGCD